jgi:hypothetical protein
MFFPKSTTYLPTATLEVFRGVAIKATRHAAVRVDGSREEHNVSRRLRGAGREIEWPQSRTAVEFFSVLRAGGARKDNSRTKNGNLGRYGKNALHDMSPGMLGDAPMPGNLLALVEPARPARKAD